MTARPNEMRMALLAMFLDAEEVAVCSYETCTYPGGVFNDSIWRGGEPETFEIARRARTALGLKTFRHRDRRKFGLAGDRLAVFRAKERAMLAGKP